jgi:hypothetical protein
MGHPTTPVAVSIVHESRQVIDAVVPLTVRGCQMYRREPVDLQLGVGPVLAQEVAGAAVEEQAVVEAAKTGG